MGLVDLTEIQDLLRCPACRSTLTLDAGTVACDNQKCAYAGLSQGFPFVDGRWPVLIDFPHSVVNRSTLAGDAHGPAEDTPRAQPAVAKTFRGIYSAIVRPKNTVAEANVRRIDRLLEGERPLILVVGGGTIGNGLQDLYLNDRNRVIAFDIFASDWVQVIADAHRMPLANGSIDAVIVQAVLEHVLSPAEVVSEIHRVLRPDGIVYAETPFMQQVHAGPYDFTRYSDAGHRWLFRDFDQLDRGVVAGAGTAMLWSIDHLARALFRSQTAGRFARLLFFWVRFADRFAGSSYNSDAASAVFFLGRRSDRSLQPIEVLREYRGGQSVPAAVEDTGGGNPSDE